MDIYNFEGVCQEDLHLYVKKYSKKYGDMGAVTKAKEDLNDMVMPCNTITTITNGEYIIATNLSLKSSSWASFDMTGSKQGKKNSFEKLGIETSSYSNVED